MCNSRGIQNNYADAVNQAATLATNQSEVKIKVVPSKLGRKGDPRMLKALHARLNDPKLSLLDALKIGGFEFHWENEVSYDSDHVQLSQRKNQLSRRLRLYKQSQQKNQEGGNMKANQQTKTTSATKRKKGHPIEPKKKKIKPEPDQSSAVIATAVQSIDANKASMNGNGGGTLDFNMQFLPAFDQQASALSSVAALPLRDHTVSLGGNAVSTSSLSSLSSSGNEVKARKLNQALSLYIQESSNLMKRCMVSSGYSPEETDEANENFLTFAERALEMEKMKVQRYRLKARGQQQELNINGQTQVPSSILTHNFVGYPHVSAFSSMNQGLLNVHNTAYQGLNMNIPQIQTMPVPQDVVPLQQPPFIGNQMLQPTTVQSNEMTNESVNYNNDNNINSMLTFNGSMDTISDCGSSQAQSDQANDGPKVLDLKVINIEGDEWKALLQNESGLDKLLGVN